MTPFWSAFILRGICKWALCVSDGRESILYTSCIDVESKLEQRTTPGIHRNDLLSTPPTGLSELCRRINLRPRICRFSMHAFRLRQTIGWVASIYSQSCCVICVLSGERARAEGRRRTILRQAFPPHPTQRDKGRPLTPRPQCSDGAIVGDSTLVSPKRDTINLGPILPSFLQQPVFGCCGQEHHSRPFYFLERIRQIQRNSGDNRKDQIKRHQSRTKSIESHTQGTGIRPARRLGSADLRCLP